MRSIPTLSLGHQALRPPLIHSHEEGRTTIIMDANNILDIPQASTARKKKLGTTMTAVAIFCKMDRRQEEEDDDVDDDNDDADVTTMLL